MTDKEKYDYINTKLKEYNDISANVNKGDYAKNLGRLSTLETMIPLEYLTGANNRNIVVKVNDILSKDPEYSILANKIDSKEATEKDMLKFADKVIKANLAVKKEKISYELNSDYDNGLGYIGACV